MNNTYRFFTNSTAFGDSTAFIAASKDKQFVVSKTGYYDTAMILSYNDCITFVARGLWKELTLLAALAMIPEHSWNSVIKAVSIPKFLPIDITLTDGNAATVWSDRITFNGAGHISLDEFDEISKAVKKVKKFLIDNPQ